MRIARIPQSELVSIEGNAFGGMFLRQADALLMEPPWWFGSALVLLAFWSLKL
jgi:hypothetical protein